MAVESLWKAWVSAHPPVGKRWRTRGGRARRRQKRPASANVIAALSAFGLTPGHHVGVAVRILPAEPEPGGDARRGEAERPPVPIATYWYVWTLLLFRPRPACSAPRPAACTVPRLARRRGCWRWPAAWSARPGPAAAALSQACAAWNASLYVLFAVDDQDDRGGEAGDGDARGDPRPDPHLPVLVLVDLRVVRRGLELDVLDGGLLRLDPHRAVWAMKPSLRTVRRCVPRARSIEPFSGMLPTSVSSTSTSAASSRHFTTRKPCCSRSSGAISSCDEARQLRGHLLHRDLARASSGSAPSAWGHPGAGSPPGACRPPG